MLVALAVSCSTAPSSSTVMLTATSTPTITPTPTATATPTPEGPSITRWLREAGWPEAELDKASLVAYCESRWDPRAIGDQGTSFGLFQIKYFWFELYGYPFDLWLDPIVNAKLALRIWQDYGWEVWSCG